MSQEFKTDPDIPELLIPDPVQQTDTGSSTAAKTPAAPVKEKAVKNGVSLLFTIFLLFATNAVWFGYIKLYVEPHYDTQYSQYITFMQEKEKEMAEIKLSFEQKEKELEEKVTQAETALTELQQKYDDAMKLLEKYTEVKQ